MIIVFQVHKEALIDQNDNQDPKICLIKAREPAEFREMRANILEWGINSVYYTQDYKHAKECTPILFKLFAPLKNEESEHGQVEYPQENAIGQNNDMIRRYCHLRREKNCRKLLRVSRLKLFVSRKVNLKLHTKASSVSVFIITIFE